MEVEQPFRYPVLRDGYNVRLHGLAADRLVGHQKELQSEELPPPNGRAKPERTRPAGRRDGYAGQGDRRSRFCPLTRFYLSNIHANILVEWRTHTNPVFMLIGQLLGNKPAN